MNAARSSMRLIVVLVAVAGVLAPPGVFAGTRRDDVADSEYLNIALSYQTVGQLNVIGAFGSATLISPNYILTAAHVAEDIVLGGLSDGRFHLGGETYYASEIFLHPDWDGDAEHGSDIAVVRLNRLELTIGPAKLYTGSSELGRVGTYVGYGNYGTGTTGAVGNDGQKRAGNNVIDELGSYYGYPNSVLLADFDSPHWDLTNRMGSSEPIGLEYCPAPGDSGGGMFITVGGTEYLAGVNSFAKLYGGTNFDYNDVPAVTRVSSFAGWVTSTIAGSGDTMVWQAAVSGSFNDNTKWQRNRDLSPLTRQVVPGLVDSAMFNKAGSYTVTFPGSMTNERINVRDGNVTLNLSGYTYTLLTTDTVNASIVVGDDPSVASTRLTIANGTVLGQRVIIGYTAGAHGTLQLNGGQVSNTDGYLGYYSGSSGTVTVDGIGSVWTNTGSLYVGGNQSATGGTGSVTVKNGGRLSVGGTLKMWKADSAVTVSAGTLTAGGLAGSTGTIRITNPAGGTALTVGSAVSDTFSGTICDDTGPGSLTKVGSGTQTLAGVNTYTGNTSITGGTLEIGGAGQLGSGNYAGAIAIAAAKTFKYNSSADQTLSGIIGTAVTAGILVKDGAGTLTLTNANIYTGATSITAGTLVVGSAGAINSSSGITLNGATAAFMQNSSVANSRTFTLTQGTLGGTGTISTPIASGANVIIAPGDRTLVTPAAGALTITNAVNLAGGTTAMRLFSSTTNDCDKLVQSTTGTINFGGDLNVTQSGSWTWVANRTYDLFDWIGTKTGTFNNLYLPTLPSSVKWHDYSGGGSPVYFDYTTGNIQVDAAAGNFWAPAAGGGGSGTWDSTATVWAAGPGVQGTVLQADTGALIFTDAAGTVTVNGTVTANEGLKFETDGYDLAAGTTPEINLAGASPAANTVTTDPGVTATISAQVTGSNGMTKDGTGTLVLSGDNAYGGPTTVNAGTLLVNNTSGSGTGSGTVTVSSTGTLGGTGTIWGTTTINGHHTPGASAGIQTFGTDLTYNTGSDVTWELVANTATQGSPAVFDQIVVGGNLSFDGPTALALKFDAAGSTLDWTDAFWDDSQRWLVYDAGLTSNFDNLVLTVENWQDSNGVPFDTAHPGKYFYRSSDGEDVMLNYLLPGDATLDRNVDFLDYVRVTTNYGVGSSWTQGDVTGDGAVDFLDYVRIATNYGAHTPEPATLALLGLGGLGVLLGRKRK